MAQSILALKVRSVEHAAADSAADQETKDAAARARVLLTTYGQATTVQADKDAAAAEIDQIYNLVRAAVNRNRSRTFSVAGIAGIGFVAILMVWLIIWYLTKSGVAALADINNTRPLLVITAIMSTVVFGGALLLAALFTSEPPDQFEPRFRHAREIFLVFSGIFGTVIGFYFGAGDSSGRQLQVSAQSTEAAITAHATGGTPPYQVTFTPKNNAKAITEKSENGWVRFDSPPDKAGELSVIDINGKQGKASVEPSAPPSKGPNAPPSSGSSSNPGQAPPNSSVPGQTAPIPPKT